MKASSIFFLVFFLIKVSAFAQDSLNYSAALDTLTLPPDTLHWESQKIKKNLEIALKNKQCDFRLDLSRQKLKAVPPEIFQFTELRELNLSSNKISIFPPEIKVFTHLAALNFSNNKIVEVPVEIGTLKHLKTIHINRNEITTLPQETGQLTKLEILDMWSNELDSLPSSIQHLKRLKVLELRNIIIPDPEQARIKELLPHTTINFSPSCNCKY